MDSTVNADPQTMDKRTLAEILNESDEARRAESLRALITRAQRALVAIPDDADLIVALDHPRLGHRDIGIVRDSGGGLATLAETAYADITRAIEQAARQSVDPDSYDTQEEYDSAVARRASQFEITGITRTGENHRWRVRVGSAHREPDLEVYAPSQSDAEFLARWAQGRAHRSSVRLDSIEGFIADLFAIEIATVEPEPVSLAELYDTVASALTPGAEPGSWVPTLSPGPAWERLHAALRKLHSLYGMPAPPTKVSESAPIR